MILITNADHFVGHSITSHLAQFEHLRPHLRILCQNKTPCLNFSNKGIDVRQVNYMHPNDLALAMRGVGIMILAVGNEEERVSYSERLCKAANRYGINSIVCISHVGAGASSHETLQHFARIEDEVIGTDCQWTLLRLDWIQQYFHLWAPYIEKHRQLALPLPEDAEICPIDIIDICRVVQELVLTDGNRPRYMLHDDHVGQVYTLTGPQSVMGKQIVKWLSMDTGYSKLGYRFVRLMDARYYLEELPADIWFDARLKQEGRQIYNDALDDSLNYRYRAFAAPTATQIQTFLDYFDWVHKTSSSVVVPHATAITYLPAQSIRTFFRENANRFKPRV